MDSLFPRFSVIVPNFNNGATLERALRSILSQTYAAHEIIVIDDGSTDDSQEVAKKFGSQIRYVFQANAGVSAARNNGAKLATGDWLAFLDADDIYLSERLRAHADWIKDDPTLDFLLADQESRTPDGKLLNLFMPESKAGQALLAANPGSKRIPLLPNAFETLISDGFAEIRTLSLPRKTFLELGGFPTEHKIGEDLHFFIRLYAASALAGVTPTVLSTYYIYGDSALRKNPLRTMQLFVEALDSLENELKNAPLPIKAGFEAKRRHTRLSLAYAYLRINQKGSAIRSVLPSFFEQPSLRTLKDLLSICRGFSDDANR